MCSRVGRVRLIDVMVRAIARNNSKNFINIILNENLHAENWVVSSQPSLKNKKQETSKLIDRFPKKKKK